MNIGIIVTPCVQYDVPAAMNEAIEPASVIPSSRIWPSVGLAVVKHLIGIDRLVKLADVVVNAALLEERVHAEGARFVGHDRHDILADFLVFQQAGSSASPRRSWSTPRGRRSSR